MPTLPGVSAGRPASNGQRPLCAWLIVWGCRTQPVCPWVPPPHSPKGAMSPRCLCQTNPAGYFFLSFLNNYLSSGEGIQLPLALKICQRIVPAFCGLELTRHAQICFSFTGFSQITRVVFFPLIGCDSTEGRHPFSLGIPC